jgi:hypothetical protein
VRPGQTATVAVRKNVIVLWLISGLIPKNCARFPGIQKDAESVAINPTLFDARTRAEARDYMQDANQWNADEFGENGGRPSLVDRVRPQFFHAAAERERDSAKPLANVR